MDGDAKTNREGKGYCPLWSAQWCFSVLNSTYNVVGLHGTDSDIKYHLLRFTGIPAIIKLLSSFTVLVSLETIKFRTQYSNYCLVSNNIYFSFSFAAD